MKKTILVFLIMLLFMEDIVLGNMTYGGTNYIDNIAYAKSGRKNRDPIYKTINEIEAILNDSNLADGDMIYFDANTYVSGATASTLIFGDNVTGEDLRILFSSDKATLYSSTGVTTIDFNDLILKTSYLTVGSTAYTLPATDGTNGQLLKTNGSAVLSWTSAGAGAVSDLDTAYNGGSAVTVDGDAITLTVTNTSNNRGLDVVQNDTTNNPETVRLTNTGTGDTLQFASSGVAGKDIDGSGSTWSVTAAGVGTFTGLTAGAGSLTAGTTVTSGTGGFVLTNAATITNATNTEIAFTEDNGTANETLSLDFLVDEVDLKSTTGVVTLGFGDIDDLTGINNITFDADYSAISLTANSDGDNFAISLLGAQDAHLAIFSNGTSDDALTIESENGGIDILCSGATTGEDIDIYNTGASVNVTATEAVADAIVFFANNAAAGIDITAGADIDITTTGAAGEDITIANTGGSIDVNATEAVANAIRISASNAAGGVDVNFGTGNMDILGTGASADFALDCDLASFDFTGTTNFSMAGTAEDMTISVTGAADNHLIVASSGTSANALQLTASAGGISETALDDILLTLTAATAHEDVNISTIGAVDTHVAVSSTGTDVNALILRAAAGGIDVDGKDDVIITCASTTTNDNLAINQTGAVDAGIKLSAAGTGAAAISLQALAGGLDADFKDDIIITCASTTTADDFRLVQTGAVDASISLEAAGTGADAIRLQSPAGGLDIDAKDDIIITVASTTSGDNLALQQTGAFAAGITLAAAGTGDDAIDLAASAGGVDIDGLKSVTVTSTENTVDAVKINSTVGGLIISADGGASSEDVNIVAATSTLALSAGEADANAIWLKTLNAAGGITIGYGTGNMAITGTGASADFTLDADLLSIDGTGTSNITVTSNAGAEDFTVALAGATDSHLVVSSTGTSADALQLTASAGGVKVATSGAMANQFYVTAVGAFAGDVINMATTDGGIALTAAGAANGDITINAADILTLTQADATGIVINGGNASFVFEGVTADDYETTVTVSDPKADRTITLPDYTGSVPIIADQSTIQTSIVNNTATVTDTSIALPAAWFNGGETIRYRLFGTKVGANAAMVVNLYLLDGNVLTLTAADADAGDWTADIYCMSTAAATQDCFGTFMQTANAVVFDHATGAKDLAAGGNIYCTITSANGADTVTVESIIVEVIVKD